jgi:hypothetical protein
MSKRQLASLEAAPLILANERARAHAQKPKPSKGERVRKQRPHVIAPQEDQPVSAHLRSSKRKTVIEAKKMGDEDDYQYARLEQNYRLQDNESQLETVWRLSKSRKMWCLPARHFFPGDMYRDTLMVVYSKLKTTQLPAPSNEPKERKSVTFSSHSLESEAFFYRDDPSESITNPDDYGISSFPCPTNETIPARDFCSEKGRSEDTPTIVYSELKQTQIATFLNDKPKERKSVTFRDHSLVSEAFFYRRDPSCIIDQWTSSLGLLKHISEFTEDIMGISPMC